MRIEVFAAWSSRLVDQASCSSIEWNGLQVEFRQILRNGTLEWVIDCVYILNRVKFVVVNILNSLYLSAFLCGLLLHVVEFSVSIEEFVPLLIAFSFLIAKVAFRKSCLPHLHSNYKITQRLYLLANFISPEKLTIFYELISFRVELEISFKNWHHFT